MCTPPPNYHSQYLADFQPEQVNASPGNEIEIMSNFAKQVV